MEDNSISQDEIDALINAMSNKDGEKSENNFKSPGDEELSPNLSLNPILSQDEIEVLLKVAPSVSNESKANNQPTAKKLISSKQREVNIGKYDFTIPSRLSKDHLRALNSIHSSYAKSLSSYFSMSLRTPVEIDCINIEQMTYGEYLSSIFDPTCIGIFSVKPLRGMGMFEINMPLAFPIIDTLLGGSGKPKLYNRNLTVVEESIILKVMERALSILQESWQRSIDLRIKLERLESNPQFIQAATTGDPVILILFDVGLGNSHGMMSLCFPFLTIQQALANLKREESPVLVDDEAMKLYREMMALHVRMLNIPVSVRYEPSPVTLRELLELKKGDVILLQNSNKDQVFVFASGQKRYSGKPGMVSGKRAVQISKTENDIESGDI